MASGLIIEERGATLDSRSSYLVKRRSISNICLPIEKKVIIMLTEAVNIQVYYQSMPKKSLDFVCGCFDFVSFLNIRYTSIRANLTGFALRYTFVSI